jgi:hypothetical protein
VQELLPLRPWILVARSISIITNILLRFHSVAQAIDRLPFGRIKHA